MHRPLQAVGPLILMAVIATLIAGPSQAEPREEPIVIVKDTITRILKTLGDDTLSEPQIRERVASIASERINYYEMGRRILAVNWARANVDQQRRFVALFRDLLTAAYWKRMKKYRNEEVVYFTSSIDDEIFATVDTVIQSSTVEIPVTYRLKHADGKWLAYDFLVEGQSLVSSYRNSFGQLIARHGMENLLEQMEKMVSDQA